MRAAPSMKVILLAAEHKETWRGKSQWYWAWGLLEEVGELILSLLLLHRHPPTHELCQIAAICINWMEMRGGG